MKNKRVLHYFFLILSLFFSFKVGHCNKNRRKKNEIKPFWYKNETDAPRNIFIQLDTGIDKMQKKKMQKETSSSYEIIADDDLNCPDKKKIL